MTTPSGFKARTIWRQVGTQAALDTLTDHLAVEQPVALQYNGISHAVLLATPTHLEDLALGFSYTEGIIRQASDVYDIEIEHSEQGCIIHIEIASACLNQLKQRRRQLAGRTGCGLCGLESLAEGQLKLPPLSPPQQPYASSAIFTALEQLRSKQDLHLKTGATHAAAWASLSGHIEHLREDVGRHNALDKLIGSLLHHSLSIDQGFVIVSSRASFEMVQKTAVLGARALVAVSAPTTYAVQMAQDLGVLLIAFGRDQQFNVYSHAHFLAKDI